MAEQPGAPTMTLHKAVGRLLAASASQRQDREADLAVNWYADLIDRLRDAIEPVMTKHWDMAACMCDLCKAGREAGFAPRERYLPHKIAAADTTVRGCESQ